MRKQWLGICIAAGLLAACSSDDVQQKNGQYSTAGRL
ncbi:rare lipoprotein A [Klebsiella pneumoniae]|uniref:Rare lipoprotein A n=1 Tax=Klebsiella pneumoniae TaxID=573 RepID=A0A378BJY2_KLEPN|nr:rare lipoprotein A [Klebsiella pneumoniae]